MTEICLTLNQSPPNRVDVRSLTPVHLAACNPKDLAAVPIRVGRQRVALGEWFTVRCQASAHDRPVLRFCGDLRQVDHIGAELAAGSIVVEGDAGNLVGRQMRGGKLVVHGSVAAGAACAMRGGELRIDGSAGDALGGPLPGSRQGMSGGTVIVAGSVGEFAGHRMRRGMLVIGGQTGRYAAAEMVAGTIAAQGFGPTSGQGMRRGTLVSGAPACPVDGFSCPLPQRPAVWPLLETALLRRAPAGSPLAEALHRSAEIRLYRALGDRAVGGMGEWLWLGGLKQHAD